jgi:hypothetical protein
MLVVDETVDTPTYVGDIPPTSADGIGVSGTLCLSLTPPLAIRTRRFEVDLVLRSYLSNVGGEFGGRYFEIDDVAMSRLNAALTIADNYERAFGAGKWPGMAWTDLNNAMYFVPSLPVFRLMLMRLGAQGSQYYTNWQTHKYKVAQLTDLDDIMAYDISTGWAVT